MLLSTCVIIDLYLTLKNPFYPREKRLKFYYGISALLTLVFFIDGFMQILEFGSEVDIRKRGSYKYIGMVIVLTVTSLVGTFLTVMRLRQRGTSRNVRIQVKKVQIVYYLVQAFLLFVMCVMIQRMYTYDFVLNIILWKDLDGKDKDFRNTQEYIIWKERAFWVFRMVDVWGVVISITRLSEPAVMKYLLEELNKIWVRVRYCGRRCSE
jgi:hypothetical protein